MVVVSSLYLTVVLLYCVLDGVKSVFLYCLCSEKFTFCVELTVVACIPRVCTASLCVCCSRCDHADLTLLCAACLKPRSFWQRCNL